LLEKLVENAYTGDERDGTKEQLARWIAEKEILDESMVLLTMEDLDIPDIEERIEWYNQATLDMYDVHKLCNVEFTVIKADCCDKVQYVSPTVVQGSYSLELIYLYGNKGIVH